MRFFAAGGGRRCPDRKTLIAFDLGKLTLIESVAVADHVASCDRCEEVVDALQGHADHDGVVARLRECLFEFPPPAEPDEPWLERLAATILGDSDLGVGTVRAEDLGASLPGGVGSSFGDYELCGELGHGGMGVVYRARHVASDRVVALKTILSGRHAVSRLAGRFRREVTTIVRLKHPNIVKIYELGECDGFPYFSMELAERGSLAKKLKEGPPEPKEAVRLVRTLAGAVQYVHDRGIVHRDLKPQNILIGDDGQPLLADFGLARRICLGPDETTAIQLTETHAVIGTAKYMSPEQARGDVAGPAADVYALGVILYEVLTGRPPFSGKTVAQVLERVRTERPAPPSRVGPGVPSSLDLLCLKCLEKSPEDRYASAEALADDLGEWLDHERARDVPGRLRRSVRFVRRNAAAVLTGMALASAGPPLVYATANAYHNLPSRVLGRIDDKLARGGPVTLLGATGKPKWSRWVCGEKEGHATLADDGAYMLHSWPLSLVELLPDTHSKSYKITAQVRHEESDLEGNVGVYFSRKAYPTGQSDLHFFMELTFNAVRDHSEKWARMPADRRAAPRAPRENVVALCPRLTSDESLKSYRDWKFGGVSGPRFKALGVKNGVWHDLEVTVTPGNVTARWNDGPPFSMTPAAIQESVIWSVTNPPPPPPGLSRPGFVPAFSAGGGLGLYVRKGSASFRSVTVTPF